MILETCGQAPLFYLSDLFREIENGSFEVVLCIKVLEYLRTCNIFSLINGPRVTFRIFD